MWPKQLLRDEGGANAIDYSLLAGLVAIVIIGAVAAIGDSLSHLFSAIVAALSATGKV